ncbi:hypothetical protein G7Z17_g5690 [Cylindrodendrum hubeiense]|uniref:Zn(2)-C6 fungal-type domain-containing protein n=1 Tax=Cylindrodendrum hubeiense TaxID=595255 RepID=A0A9P5HDM0_9HYPO|nr:hypothetical protein G7Z17_g5690 [Cylindrodendrum hubeiense]
MPNTGKPSKDCHLCRSRRVKCDLAKPACQRCIKYGAECPGYRTEQELVFRNANPSNIKKRKKRTQPQGSKRGSEKALSSQPSQPSPSPTATDYSTPSAYLDLNDDFEEILLQSTPSGLVPFDTTLTLPKSLNEHWTTHSVPILLNVYSSLEFLHNIYEGNTVDGPLVWAAHLFSRTYVTNVKHSTALHSDSIAENDRELGTYLGKTLSSVHIALKTPGGAMRDDVLATVWILSNYELLMGSIDRIEPMSPWHLHTRGLYSILKARGTEWLRSATGRTGFWPSYNMVQQVQCLLTNTECPPESDEWLATIKESMNPGEAIGYHVCIFITRVAHVQARILSILRSGDFAGASAEYHDLVGAMSQAEDELRAFFVSHPSTGEFDPYMRNMYCSTCVKGYHLLLAYTNFLTHHVASPIPLSVLKALRIRCIQLVRGYAQEIVDSMPRTLNQKAFRSNPAPRTLFDALKLIWPLTAVYVITSTLPEQKEVAEKSLRFIGRELGVRQALRVYPGPSLFPPEALEPLDIIKDESFEDIRMHVETAAYTSRISPENRPHLIPVGMISAPHFIQHATIALIDDDLDSEEADGDRALDPTLSDSLPMRISQSIQSMSNLQSLALDLEYMSTKQTGKFLELLMTGEKWRLTHLRLKGDNQLVPAIIKHCDSDYLQALHLHTRTDSDGYRAAAEYHKRLKKLRVDITSSHLTPPMGNDILNRIAKDFHDLEWLVVYEDGFPKSFIDLNYGDQFETAVETLVANIRKFPKLRRLAFSISRYQTPVSSRKLPECCTMGHWHYALASYIEKALPNIDEICLIQYYPGLLQGAKFKRRVGAHMIMEDEDSTIMSPNQFPDGLLDCIENSAPEIANS